MKKAIFATAGLLVLSMLIAAASASAKPKKGTCDGLEATIVGTQGADNLLGTPGPDVIVGLGGDDTINGDAGDDVICGGSGDDSVSGGDGNDRLFGDQGNDYVDGGVGGCCGPGNGGDDVLFGGPGTDDLHTSDFPTVGNTLYGEQGKDNLFLWSGGQGFGGVGGDTIRQFTGDAVMDGGNGSDDLLDWDDGGFRNETISMLGGRGPDSLASEDATSTTSMDGGSAPDDCTGGDTTTNC